MKALMFLVILLMSVELLADSKTMPPLHFGYAEACPHMCPDNANKGFTVDIARVIFEESGYKVIFHAFPWARAAANARSGKLDGVLSAGKEEVPSMVFPSEEIAVQSDCFFGRVEDSWQASDSAQAFLKRRTIVFNGWVKERQYLLDLGRNAYTNAFLHFSIDDQYTSRVVNMVKLGRADAFWMDKIVFAYNRQLFPELLNQDIQSLGCIHFQKLYLALSPATPHRSNQLAHEFDTGMKRLRKNGQLKTILARYGLSDWRER